MISSVAGWNRSSKALPKAKLASKIGHGHCLVVCYWSDPVQLSESRQNHYIRELCSANERNTLKTATPAVNRMGPFLLHDKAQRMCPTTCHTTNTSQVKRIGLRSFASSTIFTWSLTIQLPLLQASWQLLVEKMLPYPAGGRKCFPRVHWNSKHGYVCYRNKQTYLWLEKCVDCNGSYFDLSEPTYNDLNPWSETAITFVPT